MTFAFLVYYRFTKMTPEQAARELMEHHAESVELIIDRWVKHKVQYAEV